MAPAESSSHTTFFFNSHVGQKGKWSSCSNPTGCFGNSKWDKGVDFIETLDILNEHDRLKMGVLERGSSSHGKTHCPGKEAWVIQKRSSWNWRGGAARIAGAIFQTSSRYSCSGNPSIKLISFSKQAVETLMISGSSHLWSDSPEDWAHSYTVVIISPSTNMSENLKFQQWVGIH